MAGSNPFEKCFGSFMECSVLVLKGEATPLVSPFVLSGLAFTLLVRMATVCFVSVSVRL
jgi:hypothetical protein